MSRSLEGERRAKVAEWAEAKVNQKQLKRARDEANRQVEAGEAKLRELQKELESFVGKNVNRKLYRTEHGHVLIAQRWNDSTESGRYETDVELLTES